MFILDYIHINIYINFPYVPEMTPKHTRTCFTVVSCSGASWFFAGFGLLGSVTFTGRGWNCGRGILLKGPTRFCVVSCRGASLVLFLVLVS